MLNDLESGNIALERGKGQVLTPPEIVDYMVEESVKASLETQKDTTKPLSILDPACGTGRFMLGVADYCWKKNIPFVMWNIDIDERMYEATIRHAIHYKIPAIVILGDALLNEFTKATTIQNGISTTMTDAQVNQLVSGFNQITLNNMNERKDSTP